jgi:hypothetical protein
MPAAVDSSGWPGVSVGMGTAPAAIMCSAKNP